VTPERPGGLGPLGRRLLVAFVLVALSSVLVLTVAALIGTTRGLTAGEDQQRRSVADAVAAAVAESYTSTGGWSGADLSEAARIAAAAGAGLTVRDGSGQPVASSPGMGMGNAGAGRGGVMADVVTDGLVVGTVRLGFRSPAGSTAQTVAWTWILLAAVVSILVALVVAWFVSGRITRPLVRLTQVTRAFAAGDRDSRSQASDSAAPGELGELARAFDATADDVVRSEQTRRRMAADVAHELRTPLAALQAGLEELRDGYVEPDDERLAALHAQSVRLGRVVDDLSELSAAETAALSLHRETLDLGDLVGDAVSAARASLEGAGLAVSVALQPGVLVEADPDRLHQAVGNLLSNAARYCAAGDSVEVAVASSADLAVVTVADTGPGIPPTELGQVFDRLWRGSADRDGGGTGIGLAVVRELVEAHGGSVSAASDGNSGATFTIRLPRISPRPSR
jgi:two-component system sensor histidine kinase BaeS